MWTNYEGLVRFTWDKAYFRKTNDRREKKFKFCQFEAENSFFSQLYPSDSSFLKDIFYKCDVGGECHGVEVEAFEQYP